MPNWCQRSQSLQRKSEVRISDFKTSEKLWPDFGLLLFGLWYLPHSTQESAHATPSPEHGVSGADHAMVECGDGRFQGSTFLAGDLVQGNAEVKRWDDVCFSRFPNCKVSKNFLYIRCRFFNSWRGWILQDKQSECLDAIKDRECVISHTKELGKLPVALIQSSRHHGLTLILRTRRSIRVTHHGQLCIRWARTLNFGAFSLEHVNTLALVLWWHLREDFDKVGIEDVVRRHSAIKSVQVEHWYVKMRFVNRFNGSIWMRDNLQKDPRFNRGLSQDGIDK